MRTPKIIFGTDGWRGIVETEVNIKTIGLVAQAFADYLINHSTEKDKLKVAIGYDGRRKSQSFARLFARVLSGNNIVALLSDKIGPTPVLSFYVNSHRLSAGVMITASHNPSDYNGVKFKAHYGGPFLTEMTSEVESYIGHDLVQADDEKIYQVDFRNDYYQHVESLIDFEAIKNADLNILIDSMGGAGQQVIENLLFKHDIKAKSIYKIAEKDFSGRIAEPIEENLDPLREELLKENKYSIGIATDGDADRIGIMMETGEILGAQETILLIADYIINVRKEKGDIVKAASVSERIRTLLENNPKEVVDVEVGFKHICEKMIEGKYAIGCEESGGFGFGFHIPERDGIFSSLIFIEMLAKSGYKKLSGLVKEKRKIFGDIFYKKISIQFNSSQGLEFLTELHKSPPPEIGGNKVVSYKEFYNSRNIVNGIKFSFENRCWLLLRVSGTEPVGRIYAEANSNEELKNLIDAGKDLFK